MSENNNTTDASIELQQQYERERERANNALGKLTDLEKKLEKFSNVDLDKLRADSEALQHLMKEKAKTTGNQADIDALLTEKEKKIRDELQPLLESATKDKQSLSEQLKELKVVDGVFTKIGNKFNDDMQSFVKDIIRNNIDLDDQGNFIIKDKDGKARYSASSANKLMTVEEFADELTSKYPSAVRSSVPAGLKQKGQTGVSGDISVDRYLKMSAEQRLQIPDNERRKLALEAVKTLSAKR